MDSFLVSDSSCLSCTKESFLWAVIILEGKSVGKLWLVWWAYTPCSSSPQSAAYRQTTQEKQAMSSSHSNCLCSRNRTSLEGGTLKVPMLQPGSPTPSRFPCLPGKRRLWERGNNMHSPARFSNSRNQGFCLHIGAIMFATALDRLSFCIRIGNGDQGGLRQVFSVH